VVDALDVVSAFEITGVFFVDVVVSRRILDGIVDICIDGIVIVIDGIIAVGAITVDVTVLEFAGVITANVFVPGNIVVGVGDLILDDCVVVVSNVLVDAIIFFSLYFFLNCLLFCCLLIYNRCRILVVGDIALVVADAIVVVVAVLEIIGVFVIGVFVSGYVVVGFIVLGIGLVIVRNAVDDAIYVVTVFEFTGVFVSGNNVVGDVVLSDGVVVVRYFLVNAIIVCSLHFRFNIIFFCNLLLFNGC